MFDGWKPALRWLFAVSEWLAIFLFGALSFVLGVSVPESPKTILFQDAVEAIQSRPVVAGLVLSVALVVFKGLRHAFKVKTTLEQETIAALLNRQLDCFRDVVFPDLPANIPKHENRVTIFQKVDFLAMPSPRRGWLVWPWGLWHSAWSGWLVVKYRSGHVTLDSRTAFIAPASGNAEGVVGQAWECGAFRARGLPNLNSEEYVGYYRGSWYRFREWVNLGNPTTKRYVALREKIHDYAAATRNPPRLVWKRLKSGRTIPLSILGILLYDVYDRVWGVLVVDSSNEFECMDSEDPKFRKALRELNKELKRLRILGSR